MTDDIKSNADSLITAWETPESCPRCREHLSLDWSYCPECGRPISPEEEKHG